MPWLTCCRKVRDRGQSPASSWLAGDYAVDRVFTTPLPRVHDNAELIVAADRRIGTPEAALPQRETAPKAPARRAVRIHESRKYQGLEALTQRSVHQPDSSDVDDSSRLAQWRLASPEPRGDVRDAVWVIQVLSKTGRFADGGSVTLRAGNRRAR